MNDMLASIDLREYLKLKSERDLYRKVLEDIASGELGINLCIKHAKRALSEGVQL